jgi:hypothetical protein
MAIKITRQNGAVVEKGVMEQNQNAFLIEALKDNLIFLSEMIPLTFIGASLHIIFTNYSENCKLSIACMFGIIIWAPFHSIINRLYTHFVFKKKFTFTICLGYGVVLLFGFYIFSYIKCDNTHSVPKSSIKEMTVAAGMVHIFCLIGTAALKKNLLKNKQD